MLHLLHSNTAVNTYTERYENHSILFCACQGRQHQAIGFSKVALVGSKPPHPRVRKSVVPVGRDRAKAAPRSFTLFLERGGEEEKDF
jgi:hypothetical protein